MMRSLLAAVLVVWSAIAPAKCPDYATGKNAYFGDLHNHTAYSLDAYNFGTRTDPAASYAFATGTAVNVGEGYDASQGEVPGPFGYTLNFSGGKLDFAAVTDHSEWLSTDYGCTVDTASPFYNSSYCTSLRNLQSPPAAQRPCRGFADQTGTGCLAEQTAAWAAEGQATEAANDACTFTTFHAYEWTFAPGQTLHKNVFFKDANVPAVPIDAQNYPFGSALWAALAAQCNGSTGCEALTIPHNMNQSEGLAFSLTGYTPIDLNRMLKYQRLVEVHQHKGNSECLTDTADSGAVTACDFEVDPDLDAPADDPGYARRGLEQGITRFVARGYDPHQVGFVGATDNHDGTPGAVAEDGYVGHIGSQDNTPARRLAGNRADNNPGGVTGVWAEENTRAALWAAFKRRETFATSGPRIKVRFYAYTGLPNPCADPSFPAQVQAGGGVPMGGTIRSVGAPPSFVVYAVQDQTALASVDVVKASVVGGSAVEKVYAIPFAGAPYCVTWTDPDFDASEAAFYYARVKEAPTWRWTHYDCEALKVSNPLTWQTIAPGCLPAGGLDVMVQERAWTSSIWYLPGGPVTIGARTLKARDGSATSDPAKRRFTFKAVTKKDAADHRVVLPLPGSNGDPTATGATGGGATLDVYNPDTGEHVTAALPASGWSLNGAGTRYTFADAIGAVQKVKVGADKITIKAGKSAWGYTLNESRQGSIAVRLRLGAAAPWCAEAPAKLAGNPATTLASDLVDKFTGQSKSPAPDQCPVLASASGAFLD